ncbi:DUF6934 family protein [Dyadobacter jiangsuensis]|uniref:Uncharacterized protein n=1 Tax=Dyadobacter jiangsuensis TaxID=1591085 RepID=A0A2P8FQE1_9BACT|nr:hypothetical protein [Dyadobacter jiangsuensis]PSL23913.1 hypothetical protein CLV60_115109 [Dyadobacter jiangsuensis]
MHYDQYEITPGDTALTFEFVSQGVKGDVEKLVVYSRIGLTGTFNMGFGNKIGSTEDFDDSTVTNNGDTQKVMATVAATLYPFTDRFPDAKVYFKGSTRARTRLYRIGISNNLELITLDFQIYGLNHGQWEKFVLGIDYEAFLVTRKKKMK